MLKKIFCSSSLVLLVLSFGITVSAQSEHKHLLVQEIVRKEALEIVAFPDAFQFAQAKVAGAEQFRFQNFENSGETSTRLVISDTRSKGGFKVLLTIEESIEASEKSIPQFGDATVKLRGRKLIDNRNLFLMTSAIGENAANGVFYPAEYAGITNIRTPFDSRGLDVNSFSSYTQNGVDLSKVPILLMDGTLPPNNGRNGTFGIDVNFALKIERYQSAGNYKMNFVYTVIPT
jgi:hypothetical protein